MERSAQPEETQRMFKRFTERARRVIILAREEAERHHHEYLGTEHILLGMLKDGGGIAITVLQKAGLSIDQIRMEVERHLPRNANALIVGEIPFTPKAKKVLEYGVEEARLMGHNYIGTEHLLLGLLKEKEGIAAKVLNALGIRLVETREKILNLLQEPSTKTKQKSKTPGLYEFARDLTEIVQAENVMIFIDELHTLVGAGAAEGSVDASNMLKPALSRGEIQCIGATTLDEYRKYIEKNGALERRFQPIMVDPPSVEESIEILKGLRDRYEEHHHLRIPNESIVQAVKLSARYVTERFLPDKAIDVMDEAGARVRLRRITPPPMVRDLQRKINEIVRLKKEKIENQEFEKAVELRDQEEDIRRQIDTLKQEWEDTHDEREIVVTEEDMAYVVSRMTGIPLSKIEEAESQRLLNMEDELHQRVVGQEEAIAVVTRAIRRSRAGLKDPRRPVGTFIFLGPTGVGKTELARALAEFLFGNESALIRVDMSEYMERFNVSRLTGAPPGYIGYDEGGQLTEQVRRKPYSVVLLDEIEKAHPDIYHVLLQVMDDGHLTDSYGRKVDFKNVVLIMTSNLSARAIEKNTAIGFQKDTEEVTFAKMKESVMNELKKTFNPEFLNRIDEAVMFHTLTMDHIKQIVDIMLRRLNQQMGERGITLEIDDNAKEWLAQQGYDSAYGARPLRRAIQRHIEDPLSEEVLRGEFPQGGVVQIKLAGEELVFLAKQEDAVESLSDS